MGNLDGQMPKLPKVSKKMSTSTPVKKIFITGPNISKYMEVSQEEFKEINSNYLMNLCDCSCSNNEKDVYHLDSQGDFDLLSHGKEVVGTLGKAPFGGRYPLFEFRKRILYFLNSFYTVLGTNQASIKVSLPEGGPQIFSRWMLGLSDEKKIYDLFSQFFHPKDLREMADLIEKYT